MLDSSFLLFAKHLLLNILVPLIPGILFLWIFFGKRFAGLMLYLLSWLLGFGIVAFGIFNVQFFHFGVGVGTYSFLLGLLLLTFVLKVIMKKYSFKEYFSTLKISFGFTVIKSSFSSLPKMEKIFFVVGSIFGLYFLVVTFLYRANLPSYGDDTFGNWNQPAANIYYDGGVKMWGDKAEILGRGKLGYPIYAPLYKAVLSDFAGGFDDIYINMWQWLLLLVLILFTSKVIFDKTKNILYAVLPTILICSLPLIFFHAVEGYMELASAVFAVVSIWAFWKFLEERDGMYITLGLLFGFILANLKNDGIMIYFPGIIIGFALVLLMKKSFVTTLKTYFGSKQNLWYSVGSFVFFFVPFLIIKLYYGLGFNQAAGIDSGVGMSSRVHWEIFQQFPVIFGQMDNYNIVIVVLALFIYLFFRNKKKRDISNVFLLLTPLIILSIFVLVFLLTENYRFALDQTTINRVFTMSFVIFFAFSPLFALYEKTDS